MIRAFILSGAMTAALACCGAVAQQQAPLKLHAPAASVTPTLKLPVQESSSDTVDSAQSASGLASGLLSGLSDFTGTLDGHLSVHFTIIRTANHVEGSFFLTSDLQDHSFHGKMIDADSFSARVDGETGPAASPYLYLKVNKSHSSGDWLSGALYGDSGSNQHGISLVLKSNAPDVFSEDGRYAVAGASSDQAVEQTAQAFWRAIINNQPEKAAQLVAYPLAYTDNGRRSLLHTREDFEKKFSSIFTPEYVAELKLLTPKAMTADSQGIRLGDGQVLFNAEGKAFALNNQQVRMFAGRRFMTNAGWRARSTAK
jgi:hypothetical protein